MSSDRSPPPDDRRPRRAKGRERDDKQDKEYTISSKYMQIAYIRLRAVVPVFGRVPSILPYHNAPHTGKTGARAKKQRRGREGGKIEVQDILPTKWTWRRYLATSPDKSGGWQSCRSRSAHGVGYLRCAPSSIVCSAHSFLPCTALESTPQPSSVQVPGLP